jgi:hypothetical protein
MLRERALGESLWESVLPEELRELPPELARVDELLDEDRLLVPFRRRLTATTGRPTIPIETYLRLAYLRHRHKHGLYQSEVAKFRSRIVGYPHRELFRVAVTKGIQGGVELLDDAG